MISCFGRFDDSGESKNRLPPSKDELRNLQFFKRFAILLVTLKGVGTLYLRVHGRLAGTYLYHPHPHMQTGLQVYRGLAGIIIVHDPQEDKIGLPTGEQDLSLVIQDRRVDASNRFVYQRTMMDHMSGVLGDTIMVNGRPNAALRVERRPHRLRLANVSNARIYKLAWSDRSPLHVIGTDGGLLSGEEGPQKRPFVVLAPGQRVEIWEDFSNRKADATVNLISEKFTIQAGMRGDDGQRDGRPRDDEYEHGRRGTARCPIRDSGQ